MTSEEENVKVIVRVRPTINSPIKDNQNNSIQDHDFANSLASSIEVIDPQTVKVCPLYLCKCSICIQKFGIDSKIDIFGSRKDKQEKIFKISKVLDFSSCNEDIYDEVKDLIDVAIKGYNASIVTYGSTSTGKSYTMYGNKRGNNFNNSQDNIDDNGIVMKSIKGIFETLNQIAQVDEEIEYEIELSYVDYYCSYYRNLLRDDLNSNANPSNVSSEQDDHIDNFIKNASGIDTPLAIHGDRVEVRESPVLGVFLSGPSLRFPIKNEDEAFALISKGEKNRGANKGHSILSIYISIKLAQNNPYFDYTLENDPTIIGQLRLGKFHFVDLAGGERINDSKNDPDAPLPSFLSTSLSTTSLLSSAKKTQFSTTTTDTQNIPYLEKQSINKSLSALGDVLQALSLNSSIMKRKRQSDILASPGNFSSPPPKNDTMSESPSLVSKATPTSKSFDFHIPYLNSKITHFLKDTFGGNGRTALIAHVAPEGGENYHQTIVTLQHATKAMKIVNTLLLNKLDISTYMDIDFHSEVSLITQLKQKLLEAINNAAKSGKKLRKSILPTFSPPPAEFSKTYHFQIDSIVLENIPHCAFPMKPWIEIQIGDQKIRTQSQLYNKKAVTFTDEIILDINQSDYLGGNELSVNVVVAQPFRRNLHVGHTSTVIKNSFPLEDHANIVLPLTLTVEFPEEYDEENESASGLLESDEEEEDDDGEDEEVKVLENDQDLMLVKDPSTSSISMKKFKSSTKSAPKQRISQVTISGLCKLSLQSKAMIFDKCLTPKKPSSRSTTPNRASGIAGRAVLIEPPPAIPPFTLTIPRFCSYDALVSNIERSKNEPISSYQYILEVRYNDVYQKSVKVLGNTRYRGKEVIGSITFQEQDTEGISINIQPEEIETQSIQLILLAQSDQGYVIPIGRIVYPLKSISVVNDLIDKRKPEGKEIYYDSSGPLKDITGNITGKSQFTLKLSTKKIVSENITQNKLKKSLSWRNKATLSTGNALEIIKKSLGDDFTSGWIRINSIAAIRLNTLKLLGNQIRFEEYHHAKDSYPIYNLMTRQDLQLVVEFADQWTSHSDVIVNQEDIATWTNLDFKIYVTKEDLCSKPLKFTLYNTKFHGKESIIGSQCIYFVDILSQSNQMNFSNIEISLWNTLENKNNGKIYLNGSLMKDHIGTWSNAIIVKVYDDQLTYDVKYEDGLIEEHVHKDLINLLRRNAGEGIGSSQCKYSINALVEVQVGTIWYPATITYIYDDGYYDIESDFEIPNQHIHESTIRYILARPASMVRMGSLSSMSIPQSGIVLLSKTNQKHVDYLTNARYHLKDKVEGNYKGKGKWYPGMIYQIYINHETNSYLYDIDYSSGQRESQLTEDKLRPLISIPRPSSSIGLPRPSSIYRTSSLANDNASVGPSISNQSLLQMNNDFDNKSFASFGSPSMYKKNSTSRMSFSGSKPTKNRPSLMGLSASMSSDYGDALPVNSPHDLLPGASPLKAQIGDRVEIIRSLQKIEESEEDKGTISINLNEAAEFKDNTNANESTFSLNINNNNNNLVYLFGIVENIDEQTNEYQILLDNGEIIQNIPPDIVFPLDGIGSKLLSPSAYSAMTMTPLPTPKPVFVSGQLVEVNYRGIGNWYRGRIKRVRDYNVYDVLYDNGMIESRVTIENIRLVTNLIDENANLMPKFNVNDIVEIYHPSHYAPPSSASTVTTFTFGNWYEAKVTRVRPNRTYDIVYLEDNNLEYQVPEDKLRLFSPINYSSLPVIRPYFQINDQVKVKTRSDASSIQSMAKYYELRKQNNTLIDEILILAYDIESQGYYWTQYLQQLHEYKTRLWNLPEKYRELLVTLHDDLPQLEEKEQDFHQHYEEPCTLQRNRWKIFLSNLKNFQLLLDQYQHGIEHQSKNRSGLQEEAIMDLQNSLLLLEQQQQLIVSLQELSQHILLLQEDGRKLLREILIAYQKGFESVELPLSNALGLPLSSSNLSHSNENTPVQHNSFTDDDYYPYEREEEIASPMPKENSLDHSLYLEEHMVDYDGIYDVDDDDEEYDENEAYLEQEFAHLNTGSVASMDFDSPSKDYINLTSTMTIDHDHLYEHEAAIIPSFKGIEDNRILELRKTIPEKKQRSLFAQSSYYTLVKQRTRPFADLINRKKKKILEYIQLHHLDPVLQNDLGARHHLATLKIQAAEFNVNEIIRPRLESEKHVDELIASAFQLYLTFIEEITVDDEDQQEPDQIIAWYRIIKSNEDGQPSLRIPKEEVITALETCKQQYVEAWSLLEEAKLMIDNEVLAYQEVLQALKRDYMEIKQLYKVGQTLEKYNQDRHEYTVIFQQQQNKEEEIKHAQEELTIHKETVDQDNNILDMLKSRKHDSSMRNLKRTQSGNGLNASSPSPSMSRTPSFAMDKNHNHHFHSLTPVSLLSPSPLPQ